jgi:lipoprotein-anchoring transpeptidase ErfK/SrfK
MTTMNRRAFVTGGGAGLAALALAGCENPEPFSGPFGQPPRARTPEPVSEPIFAPRGDVTASYGPVTGEPFPIPAAPLSRINPAFLRTRVNYQGRETPGTIVVDPARRYLYLVQDGGRAIRYGVGVGREGFGWSGTAEIKDKQAWPDWYPPKEMIQRQPEIRKQVVGLEGGLGVPGGTRNPLGARAMYLWQNGKDTLYRIHGTLEPWTIGTNVSSGCIRMINQDAIDLYERVPLGTKVVVLS